MPAAAGASFEAPPACPRMLALRAPLVLASHSPRRRDLLRHLGLRFTPHPSEAAESSQAGTPPHRLVEDLARLKAADVARHHPEALTLGADTLVLLEGEVLGKPAGAEEARAMLRRLSGRTHTVLSGLALIFPPEGRSVTAHEATEVTFAPLSEQEIDAYVATGSPLDKAGAYGIQDDLGALFVARIEGDYYNVVGLPLHRLYRMLRLHFPELVAL